MHTQRHEILKHACVLMAGIMLFIGLAPRTQAGFVGSSAPSEIASQRGASMDRIQATLEQKSVRQHLETLGYSSDEVQVRLNRMSDGDLHALSLQLDQAQVAGDGGGLLLAVIIIAAIIACVYYFGNDIKTWVEEY